MKFSLKPNTFQNIVSLVTWLLGFYSTVDRDDFARRGSRATSWLVTLVYKGDFWEVTTVDREDSRRVFPATSWPASRAPTVASPGGRGFRDS